MVATGTCGSRGILGGQRALSIEGVRGNRPRCSDIGLIKSRNLYLQGGIFMAIQAIARVLNWLYMLYAPRTVYMNIKF